MTLDEVIGGTDAIASLDAARDAAWACTDSVLLARCRRRIAEMLGAPAPDDTLGGAPADGLDLALVDAAIAFTEQYIVDVAGVTDEQVAPLRDALGDQGLVDFLHALLVVEQRIRLELIWDSVL